MQEHEFYGSCFFALYMRLYNLLLLICLFVVAPTKSLADKTDTNVVELPQHAFPKTIPPGNYSGITWLGDNHYAVVSDKSKDDGFFIFEINTDSVTGEILSAKNLGFKSSGQPNRDDEGIAYNPQTNTVFISGEDDNIIKEYRLDGSLTGRQIPPTPYYQKLPANLGLEALSYNMTTKSLWTCNESNNVLFQGYNELLQSKNSYRYEIDAPLGDKKIAKIYAHGIGTICALDNGNFLVLEREAFVPQSVIGAFVNCKLYYFAPEERTSKQLLYTWQTSVGLLNIDFANYEGMCLGPRLKDGSRILMVIADSQDQFAGVLKDWIKTFRIYFFNRP